MNIPLSIVHAYKALVRYEAEKARKSLKSRLDIDEVRKALYSVSSISRRGSAEEIEDIVNTLLEKGLLISLDSNKYTTMHMELIRKLVSVSIRPGDIQVYEWKLLRPRETPLPDFNAHRFDELRDAIIRFLTDRGVVAEKAERAANALIKALEYTFRSGGFQTISSKC